MLDHPHQPIITFPHPESPKIRILIGFLNEGLSFAVAARLVRVAIRRTKERYQIRECGRRRTKSVSDLFEGSVAEELGEKGIA